MRACRTLLGKGLRRCGAGAIACQRILSQLVTVAALICSANRVSKYKTEFAKRSAMARMLASCLCNDALREVGI